MSRNSPFRGNKRRRVPKNRARSMIYRSISNYRLLRSKVRFGNRRFSKDSMIRTGGGRY